MGMVRRYLHDAALLLGGSGVGTRLERNWGPTAAVWQSGHRHAAAVGQRDGHCMSRPLQTVVATIGEYGLWI